MLTPFDWQEGIGYRAQYVESKLAQGMPVVAVSIDEGILLFTYRRQAHKIYEIYDELAFAAIGQQSDVEALRVAAIDFTHQEGYNRSEQDVTLQRVVTALSTPIKRAFADFQSPPVVAKGLFAEVGPDLDNDSYAILDYDGDYLTRKGFAFISGSEEVDERLKSELGGTAWKGTKLKAAVEAVRKAWLASIPDIEDFDERYVEEAALLERGTEHVNRFRALN